MGKKIYYLRDTDTVRNKFDMHGNKIVGSYTRGDPLAVIVSEVDYKNNVLRYGFAAVHPNDVFVKRLGKNIAKGRLKIIPMEIDIYVPDGKVFCWRGHDLTKLIMRDIFKSVEVNGAIITDRIRGIVGAWLETADMPMDTIPSPPPLPIRGVPGNGKSFPGVRMTPREFTDAAAMRLRGEAKRRDAIPPPPRRTFPIVP